MDSTVVGLGRKLDHYYDLLSSTSNQHAERYLVRLIIETEMLLRMIVQQSIHANSAKRLRLISALSLGTRPKPAISLRVH